MTVLRSATHVLFCLASASLACAQLDVQWTHEQQKGGAWIAEGEPVAPGEDGVVSFARGKPFHAGLSATIECDLDATPCLEILAHESSGQWRLTAQIPLGPEIVLADFQVMGTCRRNLARRLGARGRQELTLRLSIWGWGGGAEHYVHFTPTLIPLCEESDATALGEAMAEWDARIRERAAGIECLVQGHPRLRFNRDNRAMWKQRAATTHADYAHPLSNIIADLQAAKAEEPYKLTPESYKAKRPAWGQHLLSVRPPTRPELARGQGRDPFAGELLWRDLCWHDYSHWLIGAAISDDPAFIEQAKRWTLVPLQWRFWLRPGFRYFDFECAYPLQCLSFAYDIAADSMTEAEREQARGAMSQMARGLHLNTLSGHGSIYNDLRGNHTAVTMCGLGLAGLVLLGEHPEAAHWVALAEQFMLDAFEVHTSGGWLESPSYGAYGVCEWLKLAEAMRNVTGRDHMKNPFLKRFAEFQLHVSDWEGRDLGYNGGGAGEYWNQWIFYAIAREFRDRRFQWLAHPQGPDVAEHAGYGDVLWWVDPSIEPQRPTETDTGRTFEDIGVSVWRSGWDEQATLLLHHCGAKGQHKEENMNQVTLYALGERLLPDGIGGKTTDHNVPVIDDRIQNKWMAGDTLAYHCDARSGYSLGDTQHAYSGARRHVLFLRPDLVVLVDELALGEKKDRTVDFLLHPNGETSMSEDVMTVKRGEAALQACTVLPDGTMLPVSVEPIESKRATHQYAATYVGHGNLRAVTFLVISPVDQLAPMVVEAAAHGLRLQTGDRQYLLGLEAGEIAPGFSTESALWLARLDDDGPQRILVCGDAEAEQFTARLVTPQETPSGSPCVSWERE